MAFRVDEHVSMQEVLAGGGELGELMRRTDWSRTALGPVRDWPQSLRTAVSICLNSRFPILIWWGPQYVKLYNDAYRPILGESKHPRALGCPGKEIWPEIWHIIGPMLDGVYRDGRATWSDDQLLFLDRNGYLEECYFTFSYSPIRDETGGVGGIFTAVTETTERVLGERRLSTLEALSIEAKTVEEAAGQTVDILARNRDDIPFAIVYLLGADAREARLAGATGLPRGYPACPEVVDLARSDAAAGWPLADVVATNQAIVVEDLPLRFSVLESGESGDGTGQTHWPSAPGSAIVLPISHPGQKVPAGLLVLGISPRRAFDARYRSFFQSLADHFAIAFTNARAYEGERRRAEALLELDRVKTEFFSNISHEFRTPLTLQLGPLQDLLANRAGPLEDGQRQALEMVYRNSLRSLKLVNSLLDFARVEAGRAQAAYEPVDLSLFTEDLASNFRSAIERAGLRMVVDCPPLSEPVYVDRNMWEQIVLNLLSNAFKFTLAGQIDVSLREEAAGDGSAAPSAVLTVRDTGVGIGAEDLKRLFERFYRGRERQARTFEGTGIGLALVRELVSLHSGAISVESTPGQGSAFTVTLPLGRSHLHPDRIVPPRGSLAAASPADRSRHERAAVGLTAQSFVEEALHWLPAAPKDGQRPLPAPSEPPDGSDHRPRIVVADDNADMLGYIARILGAHYQLEPVGDGEQALAAARNARPDLVLADVMMPCLDGFGLLAALRADPQLRAVPVVLVSARAGEEARVEGLEAGADDYLVKPFGARELLARVETRLEAARAGERREREALAESNARLQLLHEMDRAILATTSVEEIAQIAARYLRLAVDALRVAVVQFDFVAGTMRVLAADAAVETSFGEGTVTPLDWFEPLGANLRGETYYAENVSRGDVEPAQDALNIDAVRSFFSVPLMPGGKLTGALVISRAEPARPDPEFVGFSSQVAVTLAVAMQSARMVQQMAEREAALADTAALLQVSRQEFQALSRRLVEALENERAVLARNLHDEAGQSLTVIGLGLVRLAKTGHLEPEALKRVEELKQVAISTAIDLRRLATDLRPASLDRLGLIEAIQQYVSSYQAQTGLPVDVNADGLAEKHYDSDVETVLYRVTQESLTNVAQHAQAAHVEIVVRESKGHLCLSVEDDGRGFDMDGAPRPGRLGILGMRERAEMLGGELLVESSPGRGTRVSVEMPLERQAASSPDPA